MDQAVVTVLTEQVPAMVLMDQAVAMVLTEQVPAMVLMDQAVVTVLTEQVQAMVLMDRMVPDLAAMADQTVRMVRTVRTVNQLYLYGRHQSWVPLSIQSLS
jgi:hypothetical protein